jgi:hypothetical protein
MLTPTTKCHLKRQDFDATYPSAAVLPKGHLATRLGKLQKRRAARPLDILTQPPHRVRDWRSPKMGVPAVGCFRNRELSMVNIW